MEHKTNKHIRPKRERVSFYISTETKNNLKQVAMLNGLSLSAYTGNVITKELQQAAKYDGPNQ